MKSNSSLKIVRAGEGESVWAMGEKFTFKLGEQETDGAFGLAEMVAQPRNGPPPHIHHREDELFYVVDGEFAFVLGEKTFTRSKGFAAYLPKDVLHTYSNVGSRPGKLLVMPVPCGFEKFIREWSQPVTGPDQLPPTPTQQDVDKLLAAAAKFGIDVRPEAKPIPDSSVPAADPSYWVLGQFVTIKLTAQETNGQFSVVEVLCPPGTGVLQHIHVAMEEMFYVLEGTVEFALADRREHAKAGDLIFVPRGVVHGFENTSPTPVRMLDLHSPAGFEEFFRELGVPASSPDVAPPATAAPAPEQILALLRKHGMELPPQ